MKVLALFALLLAGCATGPQYELVPTGGSVLVPACEEQKLEVERWNKENPDKPKKAVLC